MTPINLNPQHQTDRFTFQGNTPNATLNERAVDVIRMNSEEGCSCLDVILYIPRKICELVKFIFQSLCECLCGGSKDRTVEGPARQGESFFEKIPLEQMSLTPLIIAPNTALDNKQILRTNFDYDYPCGMYGQFKTQTMTLDEMQSEIQKRLSEIEDYKNAYEKYLYGLSYPRFFQNLSEMQRSKLEEYYLKAMKELGSNLDEADLKEQIRKGVCKSGFSEPAKQLHHESMKTAFESLYQEGFNSLLYFLFITGLQGNHSFREMAKLTLQCGDYLLVSRMIDNSKKCINLDFEGDEEEASLKTRIVKDFKTFNATADFRYSINDCGGFVPVSSQGLARQQEPDKANLDRFKNAEGEFTFTEDATFSSGDTLILSRSLRGSYGADSILESLQKEILRQIKTSAVALNLVDDSNALNVEDFR